MALQLYDFYFMCVAYAEVPFHMTYDFFHFVRPVSGNLAVALYSLFILCALLAALGVFFRLSMAVALLGMAYSFLIDKTIYNNHYYLFLLFGFLLLFTQAHKGLSLQRPRTVAVVPFRQLWALRFMVCTVYFYGGVNKLNHDWLVYAEPVYTWLPKMYGGWVLTLSPEAYSAMAFVTAYAGLAIDLFSGIFLMFKNPLRKVLLWVLFVFHVTNAVFFNIGYFPYFSMAALVLFMDPVWLAQKTAHMFKRVPVAAVRGGLPALALGLFVAVQLALPLRHWLIPGNYLWHERGILFSWTMKLRDKEPIIRITYKVSGSNEEHEVPIHEYTGLRQLKHLGYRPLDLVRFAHFMEEELKPRYQNRDIRVYAEVYTRLNHYRPFQLLVNPYVDLTTLDVDNKISFENYTWIVPLGEDRFGLKPPPELVADPNGEAY